MNARNSAKKKPSEAELNAAKRTLNTADVLASTLPALIKWGSITICVFWISGALTQISQSWAGKETVAKIDINGDLNADVRADINLAKPSAPNPSSTALTLAENANRIVGTFGLAIGLAGVLYGRRQAKLRRDVVERLHHYQELWETMKDPNRTSSNLTKRGETRKEDE